MDKEKYLPAGQEDSYMKLHKQNIDGVLTYLYIFHMGAFIRVVATAYEGVPQENEQWVNVFWRRGISKYVCQPNNFVGQEISEHEDLDSALLRARSLVATIATEPEPEWEERLSIPDLDSPYPLTSEDEKPSGRGFPFPVPPIVSRE